MLRKHKDKRLAFWVDRQRQNQQKGKLTPNQIEQLDAVGFHWGYKQVTPSPRTPATPATQPTAVDAATAAAAATVTTVPPRVEITALQERGNTVLTKMLDSVFSQMDEVQTKLASQGSQDLETTTETARLVKELAQASKELAQASNAVKRME